MFSWTYDEPSYLCRVSEPEPVGGGEVWVLSDCNVYEALDWSRDRANGRRFELAVIVDDVEDESEHGLVWLTGPAVL